MKPLDSAERVAAAVYRLPKRPKAVVFDLDGTLIDSEALVLGAYMAAAEKFSLPFSRQQFLTLVGQHREATDRRLQEYFGAFPLEQFHAEVSKHIGAGAAPLKDGALELMDALDTLAMPYALATSSGRPWVDRHFAHHRLHARFRAVITRSDVLNRKPHPDPYLKAAAALGHAPVDILAIEDSPTGCASAHAAGLMTILAPDLLEPDEETRSRALHIVASLREVLDLLMG